MENDILKTIGYFKFFSYPPTTEEINTFLRKKAVKRQTTHLLEKMAKKGVIKAFPGRRYTLGEYSIKQVHISNFKFQISKKKIEKIQKYVQLLAKFPQIKLIGLSGTVAMMNADSDDDIDLFIIAARNRLFTGRFIALILAQLFGLRRKREGGSPRRLSQKQASSLLKNKVCLNLFFDEVHLEVPNFKKTEYVAHEALQMKPLVVKDDTYLRFLKANKWMFKIFPNAPRSIPNFLSPWACSQAAHLPSRKKLISSLGNFCEHLLKNLQLYFIRKHQTKEFITDHQLWFHPEDFERLNQSFLPHSGQNCA